MSTTLMERIIGRRRAAEQKTLDSYRELVAAVADGDDVDPARADALLLDAARTPAQLASDVAELRERRRLVAVAAELPSLRKQSNELSGTLVSLREALRLAELEHRERSAETSRKLSQLNGQIQQAEQAGRQLRAMRPDPRQADLLAEKGRLDQKRIELAQHVGTKATGLMGRLHNLRLALKHGPQPHGGEFPGLCPPSIVPHLAYDENMLRQGVDATEADLRCAEAELKTLDARLAEINATLVEIEDRQLSAD